MQTASALNQPLKVLIYIVCYNAQNHIGDVLNRVPVQYRRDPNIRVIISDDCSIDDTIEAASKALRELKYTNYEIFKTKVNQGYGGNQKIGYNYACRNNFDYVILLHGDGQYAPEELTSFFNLFKGNYDVILGSRMLIKKNALKGKMPVIRFVSNIILTKIQNLLAQTNLSEFHSGYRAYSIKFLKEANFELNSNGFDFDTDILLQAKFLQKSIKEFPISTFYGDEKSNVFLIKYGLDIFMTTLKFKMQKMGIGCSLKFKGSKYLMYKDKFDLKGSTHYYLLKLIEDFKPKKILEIGCGPGYLAERLEAKGVWLTGIDIFTPVNNNYNEFFCENIEQFDWNKLGQESFDMVCLMDILEHLKEPERLLLSLKNNPKFENAVFIISVPNVAFFSVRLGLLFGRFNYADRGIMDIDHKRLFTYSSFQRMLKECGFNIKRTIPVSPPFRLLNQGFISEIFSGLFNLLNKILPGVFSFQIVKIAESIPTSTILINKSSPK
ncbi:MAG: bifunctional glycosyltransferase/class I SAM-dependent methyltransferase [Candidatus Omnitrophica bacterium]|nr:bifunctional glycosyltransferase/class I SAM-dependent methyltransferase [Candidatus Omnitrophota bacterium]